MQNFDPEKNYMQKETRRENVEQRLIIANFIRIQLSHV